MKRTILAGAHVFLLLCVMTSAFALRSSQAAQATAEAYSHDPKGLQELLNDILTAINAKDVAKETKLLQSLIMREDADWFIAEFGPAFGPRLAAAYEQVIPT